MALRNKDRAWLGLGPHYNVGQTSATTAVTAVHSPEIEHSTLAIKPLKSNINNSLDNKIPMSHKQNNFHTCVTLKRIISCI